jgi:hypothetical protein
MREYEPREPEHSEAMLAGDDYRPDLEQEQELDEAEQELGEEQELGRRE